MREHRSAKHQSSDPRCDGAAFEDHDCVGLPRLSTLKTNLLLMIDLLPS